MSVRRIAGLVLAASLATAPAMAQNTGTGMPAGAGVAPGTATGTAPAQGTPANPAIGSVSPATGPAAANAPGGTNNAPGVNAPGGMASPLGSTARADDKEPNPVLTSNGDFRASKIIGAAVYNDKDQKIGSVDDILLDKQRNAKEAVISVGGVLGLGAKLVEVPYDKLSFPQQVGDKTSRVMMKDATENSLNSMTTFHYASK